MKLETAIERIERSNYTAEVKYLKLLRLGLKQTAHSDAQKMVLNAAEKYKAVL